MRSPAGIRRVLGVETTTDGIPVQGMLDPDILTVMMRRVGVKRGEITRAMPEIQQAAERYYLGACARHSTSGIVRAWRKLWSGCGAATICWRWSPAT